MQEREVSKYMNKINAPSLILFFISLIFYVQTKNVC